MGSWLHACNDQIHPGGYWILVGEMPQFCCVPGCSNRSDREKHLSFHRLPVKKKLILKKWIHKIGRKNLAINESTRVCSEHFHNSRGRMLRYDEVPSLKLPSLPTSSCEKTPRRPPARSMLTMISAMIPIRTRTPLLLNLLFKK